MEEKIKIDTDRLIASYEEGMDVGRNMERKAILERFRKIYMDLDDIMGIQNTAKLALFIRSLETKDENQEETKGAQA
jgi:hypothetical protein